MLSPTCQQSSLTSLLVVAFLYLVSGNVGNGAQVDETLELPDGFQAFVIAEAVGPARHLTVRNNGDIYVALRRPHSGGGIAALRDSTGDGTADIIKYFGDTGGTGIGIHNNYLYLAHVTGVIRYKLEENELLPESTPEVIVKDLPRQRQHADKPLAFDSEGGLYINVGAPSNNCQRQTRTPGTPGSDPCPELERHAGIWKFSADKLNQSQSDGVRFATGIRHAIAITWNPLVNELYVVQHGRDQLHQLWPNLFTVEQSAQLPAEEFQLVQEGDDFGWPYCYYDQLQNKRVRAPEYGGDGQSTRGCEQYKNPFMAFPGHWAPNGLLFYTGRAFPEHYYGGAFIAFHGSWNRAPLPQQGYKVVFVPFKGEVPTTQDWEVFANGFAGHESIQSVGQAEHRPMGLAQGPDDSLYISDSVRGKIWHIVYNSQ